MNDGGADDGLIWAAMRPSGFGVLRCFAIRASIASTPPGQNWDSRSPRNRCGAQLRSWASECYDVWNAAPCILLHKRRKSLREIASELGRSKSTIARALREPVDLQPQSRQRALGFVHPLAQLSVEDTPDPTRAVLDRYRYWTSPEAHPSRHWRADLYSSTAYDPSSWRLKISDVRSPDELELGGRHIKLAPSFVAALLAWRSDTYSGPSDYPLVSAAGRVSDHSISKQTLSWPTFLGTSPSGLRQTAIRCLLQLGADGLELAAHTRLQLDAVQEYQFAFGQQTDRERHLGGTASIAATLLGDR